MPMIKKLRRSGLIWIWVAILVLIVDRFSKLWVIKHLMFTEPMVILPFFNLTLAYNTGAAFSFLGQASGWQHFLLGGLALIVSIVLLVWLARLSAKERLLSISLCLILGGALGNAWDRASYRYVIDFFDFHIGQWHFAIFNVADCAICVGAFLLFFTWFKPSSK